MAEKDFVVKLGLVTGAASTVGGNLTVNGSLYINPADTATTATHYFVETGSDGYVRPKTLANVRTEVVTTAAVNAAAATTVGTVTSGTWSATAIDVSKGGTGVTTGLTALNASNLTSGTVPDARITGSYTGLTNLTGSGTATFGTFSGSGASLTSLNASNLSSGTVPDARITGSYTGMTNLTGTGTVDFALFRGNAADTVSAPSYAWTGDTNTGMYQPAADQLGFSAGGTQRLLINSSGITVTGTATATTFSGSGASLTTLNASNLSSGTVPDARITGSYTGLTNLTGSGTATFGTFSGSGASLTSLNASNLSSGTIPDARLTGSYTGLTSLTGSGTVTFANATFSGTVSIVSPTAAGSTGPRDITFSSSGPSGGNNGDVWLRFA